MFVGIGSNYSRKAMTAIVTFNTHVFILSGLFATATRYISVHSVKCILI